MSFSHFQIWGGGGLLPNVQKGKPLATEHCVGLGVPDESWALSIRYYFNLSTIIKSSNGVYRVPRLNTDLPRSILIGSEVQVKRLCFTLLLSLVAVSSACSDQELKSCKPLSPEVPHIWAITHQQNIFLFSRNHEHFWTSTPEQSLANVWNTSIAWIAQSKFYEMLVIYPDFDRCSWHMAQTTT